MEIFEEIEEAFVLFVNGKDCGGITGLELGEEDATLFAKLRDTAADGDAVGAGFAIRETFEKKGFDFGRDGVLEALGFGVGFGPGETDDFGEKHFC